MGFSRRNYLYFFGVLYVIAFSLAIRYAMQPGGTPSDVSQRKVSVQHGSSDPLCEDGNCLERIDSKNELGITGHDRLFEAASSRSYCRIEKTEIGKTFIAQRNPSIAFDFIKPILLTNGWTEVEPSHGRRYITLRGIDILCSEDDPEPKRLVCAPRQVDLFWVDSIDEYVTAISELIGKDTACSDQVFNFIPTLYDLVSTTGSFFDSIGEYKRQLLEEDASLSCFPELKRLLPRYDLTNETDCRLFYDSAFPGILEEAQEHKYVINFSSQGPVPLKDYLEKHSPTYDYLSSSCTSSSSIENAEVVALPPHPFLIENHTVTLRFYSMIPATRDPIALISSRFFAYHSESFHMRSATSNDFEDLMTKQEFMAKMGTMQYEYQEIEDLQEAARISIGKLMIVLLTLSEDLETEIESDGFQLFAWDFLVGADLSLWVTGVSRPADSDDMSHPELEKLIQVVSELRDDALIEDIDLKMDDDEELKIIFNLNNPDGLLEIFDYENICTELFAW